MGAFRIGAAGPGVGSPASGNVSAWQLTVSLPGSSRSANQAASAFPGVEVANVYGVEVPGGDGRAGMAALVVKNARGFDTRAFYEHALASLPSYAVPVFLRLQREAEVTGTFKLRKVELQREGWDPAKLADPLFIRDDASRAYVPLDAERHRAVAAGEVRL